VFDLGLKVEWSAYSGKDVIMKKGIIVAIIDAGVQVNRETLSLVKTDCFSLGEYSVRGLAGGGARDHQSYLVAVPAGENRKDILYWPVVSRLETIKYKSPENSSASQFFAFMNRMSEQIALEKQKKPGRH